MNYPIDLELIEKAAKARYESGARRAGTGETWEMTQPLIREWETEGMEAALLAVEADIKAEAQEDALRRLERALFAVDSKHHLNGTECLCGFVGDARKRTQTEHITTAVMEEYRHA